MAVEEEVIHSILFGMGNRWRGDDGVGSYLAEHFQMPGWLSVDCGPVPENYTNLIRQHSPDDLILVDAAQMNLPAGSIRRVPLSQLLHRGFGTHALAITLTLEFVRPFIKHEPVFIGIQPKLVADLEGLSPEVLQAAEKVRQKLASQSWQEFLLLTA